MRVFAVIGGVSIEEQAFHIASRGVEVLIGTPGRLKDALDCRLLALHRCGYVVLDEGDKMVEMGFEPQLHAILAQVMPAALSPAERCQGPSEGDSHREASLMDGSPAQRLPASRLKMEEATPRLMELTRNVHHRVTCIFSATMCPSAERLARHYLRQPVHVHVGDGSGSNTNIVQRVVVVQEKEKLARLIDLLIAGPPPPSIIFASSRLRCDELAHHLDSRGIVAATIHAGKDQATREAAIARFVSGTAPNLIATDVAGRGLDIEGVNHVINYDMPKDIDIYTHRIGRTGRAGRYGVSTTFVTGEGDERDGVLCALRTKLTSCGQVVPTELARLPAAQHKKGNMKATLL